VVLAAFWRSDRGWLLAGGAAVDATLEAPLFGRLLIARSLHKVIRKLGFKLSPIRLTC
jgi:hypothetical protein